MTKYRGTALALLTIALSGLACAPQPGPAEPQFPLLSGNYLGQSPPGSEPQVFAPGIISTGLGELNSVFSPDGREFYYAVDTGMDWVLMETRFDGSRWSEPKVLPFTLDFSGVDLCLSADGQRMVYCSNRPRDGGNTAESDFDLWAVDRLGDGSWGEPFNLEAVNSSGHEFYPCLAADNTIYLQSSREGGVGGRDLYRARLVDGEYDTPENLGPVVNSTGNEGDVFVAPDQSYVIFNSRGHDRGEGGGGLFISFHDPQDGWSQPKNLGLAMAADRSDFCPMLSPDGRYFFFSSARPNLESSTGVITWRSLVNAQARPENGSTDIYWVDAEFITTLHP